MRARRRLPWVALAVVGALLCAMLLVAVPPKVEAANSCGDHAACLQVHHEAASQKAKGVQAGTCVLGSLCALGCFVLVSIPEQGRCLLSQWVADTAPAGLLGRAISPALRPPRSGAM
jgi:hypothetical protein